MDTKICTVAQHYFPPEVANLSWIAATGSMTLVTISVKVGGNKKLNLYPSWQKISVISN